MKKLKEELQDVYNLLFQKDDFLEKAVERDTKREIEEKRSGELNEEGRRQLKENTRKCYEDMISKAEKGRYETLHWVIVSAWSGFSSALLVKCGCDIFFPWFIPYTKFGARLASFLILAFATLNRLKEPKLFDGDSLIEETNTNFFKFIFCLGFSLNIFSLFLDTSLYCPRKH